MAECGQHLGVRQDPVSVAECVHIHVELNLGRFCSQNNFCFALFF